MKLEKKYHLLLEKQQGGCNQESQCWCYDDDLSVLMDFGETWGQCWATFTTDWGNAKGWNQKHINS